jgi:hypothetical protein
LDQVATVEMISLGYILKVKSIGFSLCSKWSVRKREEPKMRLRFFI